MTSGYVHFLLLQRTDLWFPELTWLQPFAFLFPRDLMRSSEFFGNPACTLCTYIHLEEITMHKKLNK